MPDAKPSVNAMVLLLAPWLLPWMMLAAAAEAMASADLLELPCAS